MGSFSLSLRFHPDPEQAPAVRASAFQQMVNSAGCIFFNIAKESPRDWINNPFPLLAAPNKLPWRKAIKGGKRVNSRNSTLPGLVFAFIGGLLTILPAYPQDYYKGKTVAVYAGIPPGGGLDAEMRLAAQFLGEHIPGNPIVTPMNMPGATGVVLANYLANVSKPDGLTLGMPGRNGFLLARLTGDTNAKYDLGKFVWIGSSGASNEILWLRKGLRITSLDELRKIKQPIVIGGLASNSSSVLVPRILAQYSDMPLRAVSGYPGMSEATLALERGEIDGIFTPAPSFPQGLITSGAIVPIFQSIPTDTKLPTLDTLIRSEQERALIHLVLAPDFVGAGLLGPPGMPDEITKILRGAYAEMARTDEYRATAAERGIDVQNPNSGDALQKYVAANLTSVSPDTLKEYLAIAGTK
jgi:tripartite-type tricarboxylate transporter receptor subunit TctC